ncbi:MAG TPA: UDP-N-acetylmuramate:L-alanyl-gamma-D-glutamyl-meso-diaminopimelate ligase [Nevskiaceae bacterium]|nr:UDP-N-acetylmuramate:L-alanyl-gamma-D-glutamyl-meso-diaminopimelate ligase [Nevskiaceae bacterium]
MHIHILGICGTFMGGLAALARAAGHKVSGSDKDVYPPMSTQLQQLGIELMEGYKPEHLQPAPDMVVVGNVVTRGNPAIEYTLDQGLPYTSGPQWLSVLLRGRHVVAIAGTHGKTTTTSMVAWILEHAGLKPGFLIGGIPANFGVSARLGEGKHFVVEADEYDTAFFDKRSKFVHYGARTCVLNNLEYDHADIFPDLAAIERQFHHLVRTVPGSGLIVRNATELALDRVMKMGCWTPVETFHGSGDWQAKLVKDDGSAFEVSFRGASQGVVRWTLLGSHNVANALAAIAAARHVGVEPQRAIAALGEFKNVKRRLELRGSVKGINVYDDFAHHPTAITTTLAGVRAHAPGKRILAVLEPRSNTMKLGVHQHELAASLLGADLSFLFQPDQLKWDFTAAMAPLGARAKVFTELPQLVTAVAGAAREGDEIVVMSNGGFGGVHDKLLAALRG